MSSIVSRSTYRQFDIVIVDNGSTEPESHAYFEQVQQDPCISVLRIDEPFNFSRINNQAAARARGSLLCFLNNDTEVISPDWLEEMVSLAVRDGVGAVGAMLYYPNNTMQHAGVVLGLGGIASHPHRGERRGMPGNYGRAALTQTMSAVTAACMVLRKDSLRCRRRIRRDAGGRVQRRRSVPAAGSPRLPECVDAVRGALSLRIGQPR